MQTFARFSTWSELAQVTPQKEAMFKRELFDDVLNLVWREYKKHDEPGVIVATFLQLVEDFPDLKELYDSYFYSMGEDVWSDRLLILRFIKKLTILYENIEVTVPRDNK